MIATLIIIFIIGYAAIALEHSININKAATALITGVLCWTVYILSEEPAAVLDHLGEHLGELSGILFFLLGAMTIVELIDVHGGFNIITDKINQTDKRKLLWIITGIAFLLSPILDNLTTTIVMISLLRKLIKDPEHRHYFIGMVIIAANAGGAWSPIGDVTTTMLWIGGQISAVNIILKLILPSLTCVLVTLTILSFRIKGAVARPDAVQDSSQPSTLSEREQKVIFFSGISLLVSVPVFKTFTHLPPYMGILLGLGILWVITEIIHGSKNDEERVQLSVAHALQKIDAPSILFFLGILLSVAALQSAGILTSLSALMSERVGNINAIVLLMGILSSVVDNVPLVAAAQGMYDLNTYPTDHYFWEFLAYATGTGGSILIIGSAAGVAAMGMEKISFGWYLKNISWLTLIGYFAGALVYILQEAI
jgi:Na+/H+ antiporter NhaD/arsenite permease-like protein